MPIESELIYHCKMNIFKSLKPLSFRGLVLAVVASIAVSGLTVSTASAAPNPVPKIVGSPNPGKTLTVDPGTWPANTKLSYLWLADGVKLTKDFELVGDVFVPVGEYTDSKLVIPVDAFHKKISVRVTATRAGAATVVVTSAQTAPVNNGPYPGAKTPKIISSATPPVVGTTLTADPGGWPSIGGRDPEYKVQWLRDGQPISGATAGTYSVKNNDTGRKISVVVDAVGYLGDFPYEPTPKTSTTLGISGKVQTAPKSQTPTISGDPSLGSTLTANPGNYPAGTAISYLWLADGKTLITEDEDGWPMDPYTANTLTITDQMLNVSISVQVTVAIPNWDPIVVTSKQTDKTNQGVWTQAPVPELKVNSRPAVGTIVSFTMRTWLPTAKGAQPTFKYQWMRNNTPISGATNATYKIVAADKGGSVWVKVTGTGSVGNGIPYAPTTVSAEPIWVDQ